MSKFAQTVIAKSDQLNSDDLIGGAIIIKITDIKINVNSDQPVSVCYENDNGKPYKPSKSMRRVMLLKWGGDERTFVGRSMTLFRDATVTFGGKAVGGIIISHMTNMENDDRFMLTSSRGQKKAIKIEHLVITPTQTPEEKAAAWVAKAVLEIAEMSDEEKVSWQEVNKKSIDAVGKYPSIDASVLTAKPEAEDI